MRFEESAAESVESTIGRLKSVEEVAVYLYLRELLRGRTVSRIEVAHVARQLYLLPIEITGLFKKLAEAGIIHYEDPVVYMPQLLREIDLRNRMWEKDVWVDLEKYAGNSALEIFRSEYQSLRDQYGGKSKTNIEAIDYQIAEKFLETVKRVDPDFEKHCRINMTEWANQIRLLRQIDRRRVEEIRYVAEHFDSHRTDSFSWADILRHPKQLRGKTKNGIDRFYLILRDIARHHHRRKDGEEGGERKIDADSDRHRRILGL